MVLLNGNHELANKCSLSPVILIFQHLSAALSLSVVLERKPGGSEVEVASDIPFVHHFD